jgi:hypothetical protein
MVMVMVRVRVRVRFKVRARGCPRIHATDAPHPHYLSASLLYPQGGSA